MCVGLTKWVLPRRKCICKMSPRFLFYRFLINLFIAMYSHVLGSVHPNRYVSMALLFWAVDSFFFLVFECFGIIKNVYMCVITHSVIIYLLYFSSHSAFFSAPLPSILSMCINRATGIKWIWTGTQKKIRDLYENCNAYYFKFINLSFDIHKFHVDLRQAAVY